MEVLVQCLKQDTGHANRSLKMAFYQTEKRSHVRKVPAYQEPSLIYPQRLTTLG